MNETTLLPIIQYTVNKSTHSTTSRYFTVLLRTDHDCITLLLLNFENSERIML